MKNVGIILINGTTSIINSIGETSYNMQADEMASPFNIQINDDEIPKPVLCFQVEESGQPNPSAVVDDIATEVRDFIGTRPPVTH